MSKHVNRVPESFLMLLCRHFDGCSYYRLQLLVRCMQAHVAVAPNDGNRTVGFFETLRGTHSAAESATHSTGV